MLSRVKRERERERERENIDSLLDKKSGLLLQLALELQLFVLNHVVVVVVNDDFEAAVAVVVPKVVAVVDVQKRVVQGSGVVGSGLEIFDC